jgi:hypothetical protein
VPSPHRALAGRTINASALHPNARANSGFGYPDKWKDYSSVAVSRDAYFENVLRGLRFSIEDEPRGTSSATSLRRRKRGCRRW